MVTVKDVKDGARINEEIVYISKPFVVLPKDESQNNVLDTGDIEHIKSMWTYYDDCRVEIRKHDLFLNNNTKVSELCPPLL